MLPGRQPRTSTGRLPELCERSADEPVGTYDECFHTVGIRARLLCDWRTTYVPALARHLHTASKKSLKPAVPLAAACRPQGRKRDFISMWESLVMSKLFKRPLPMSLRYLVPLAASISLLGGGAPAYAHHAFAAEYDSSQHLDLIGVVTKARWTNPHSWLYFAVKDPNGKVVNWGVEFGAPNALNGRGLTKADLRPGTAVHIVGYRAKSGLNYGYAVALTLGDGRSFKVGGAQDAPTAAAVPSVPPAGGIVNNN